MNEFDFGRPVKICGRVYRMDLDDDDVIRQFDGLSARLEDAGDGETYQVVREGVDLLLGDGAFDTIFEDRTVNDRSVTRLLRFLQREAELDQEGK